MLGLLAAPALAQDPYGRNYTIRILEPSVAEAIVWEQCEGSEATCAVQNVSPSSITVVADAPTHAKISAALAEAQVGAPLPGPPVDRQALEACREPVAVSALEVVLDLQAELCGGPSDGLAPHVDHDRAAELVLLDVERDRVEVAESVELRQAVVDAVDVQPPSDGDVELAQDDPVVNRRAVVDPDSRDRGRLCPLAATLLGDSMLYAVMPSQPDAWALSVPAVGVLLSANRLVRLFTNSLAAYVFDQREHTGGVLPTDQRITIERFRDEMGDWRICILSPFGARVHAPWALALRAAASASVGYDVQTVWSDDGIVLTVADGDEPPGPELLVPEADDVEERVLEELARSPVFASQFRENAARALLLPRRRRVAG